MKIVIYGSGSVGSYYGAYLTEAEEVYFIARGVHSHSLRDKGLKVRSTIENFHVQSVYVTDDPATIGLVDIVIVTIKLYDTMTIIKGCKLLVGPKTLVVSLQNGITAIDILQTSIGKSPLIGGTTYITVDIIEPGFIGHTGVSSYIVLGELDSYLTPRVQALHDICVNAGINTILAEEILIDIWSKFSFLVTLSGLTALACKSIDTLRSNKNTRSLLQRAIEEVTAIAFNIGPPLRGDIITYNLKRFDTLPNTVGSSQFYDLTHHKQLELPWLSEAVTYLGYKTGVTTPMHSFITSVLKSRLLVPLY